MATAARSARRPPRAGAANPRVAEMVNLRHVLLTCRRQRHKLLEMVCCIISSDRRLFCSDWQGGETAKMRYAARLLCACRSVSRYSTYWFRLTPWDFAAFAVSACRRLGTRMRNLPL